MRAGELNRLLKLQKVAMSSDSEGMAVETWTTVASVYALIAPIGATEAAVAAQTEERITHMITIRYRMDIGPRMRFLYPTSLGQRVFFIHSLLDLNEAHQELDCRCEEIVTVLVGAT